MAISYISAYQASEMRNFPLNEKISANNKNEVNTKLHHPIHQNLTDSHHHSYSPLKKDVILLGEKTKVIFFCKKMFLLILYLN